MTEATGRGHRGDCVCISGAAGYSTTKCSAVRVAIPATMPSVGELLQPTKMPMPALLSRIHTHRAGSRWGALSGSTFLVLTMLMQLPFMRRGRDTWRSAGSHSGPPFLSRGGCLGWQVCPIRARLSDHTDELSVYYLQCMSRRGADADRYVEGAGRRCDVLRWSRPYGCPDWGNGNHAA